jgi:hypothetical protein
METRGWLRLERWLSAMLLIVAAAWVALHFAELGALVTVMWMALGLAGIIVCLRAQLKLRYGALPASRHRRSSSRH